MSGKSKIEFDVVIEVIMLQIAKHLLQICKS